MHIKQKEKKRRRRKRKKRRKKKMIMMMMMMTLMMTKKKEKSLEQCGVHTASLSGRSLYKKGMYDVNGLQTLWVSHLYPEHRESLSLST